MARIIPVLLYKNSGLYKGRQFKRHKYIGEPINAVRIFNEKEVDELILLDIYNTDGKSAPDYNLIEKIARECFCPFSVGGGIRTLEQIRKILESGAEKVIINSMSVKDPNFIALASQNFGSSTIVVSIDYKKSFFGKDYAFIKSGKKKTKYSPYELSVLMEEMGAGEIMLTSIDKEGTWTGMDIKVLQHISNRLTIPMIASGGIGSKNDITQIFKKTNISAVGVGSFFTFNKYKGTVLINYNVNRCAY